MEYNHLLDCTVNIPHFCHFHIIKKYQIKEIDSAIKKYIKRNKIVGLAVGISHNGEKIFRKGYGYQDRKNRIPITTDKSLFRWASMSKMITSIISLKLVDQGLLDLYSDVSKLIPDLKTPTKVVKKCHSSQLLYTRKDLDQMTYIPCLGGFAEYTLEKEEPSKNLNKQKEIKFPPVTANHLLSNRSGICSYDNTRDSACPSDEEMKNPELHNKEFHHFLPYFLSNPFVSLPGEEFNYTTFGFNLMGRVLELSSGKKYTDLFHLYIKEGKEDYLKSLMPDKESNKHLFPNRCKGYSKGKETEDTDVSFKLPGGGFMSTLDDALEFCIKVSKMSTYEKLMAWSKTDSLSTYGLGFTTWEHSDEVISIGHTGHQQKASTILKYYPHQRICLVALSNDEDFKTRKFADMLHDKLIKL